MMKLTRPGRFKHRAFCIGLAFLAGLGAGWTETAFGADPLDTWTVASAGSQRNLNGVTFGNGMFVAVGDYGTILTSPDGTNWGSRPSGISGQLFQVSYGNGTYVAVGALGGVTTSTDAVHWQPQSSGVSAWLYGITYGAGGFVAVGSDYTIVASTDGTNWVKQPLTSSSTLNTLNAVGFGNGTYAAVGGGYESNLPGYGRIFTATGGGPWTGRVSGAPEFLYGVTYGNGTYVAVGGGSQLLTGPIVMALSSSDGTNWVNQSTNKTIFQNILNGVAYGGGMFVAVGQAGSVLSCPDGTNWVSRSSGVSANLTGVAFGNGVFVAVGAGATVLESGPVVVAAPGLVLSPTVITNDYTGRLQLSVTGLATGQTVLVETLLDIQGTGIPDTVDPLYQSFQITDGLVPRLGGVRNVNIPADTDGSTNGQISVSVDLNGDFGMGRVVGTYFYRVSDPAQGFAPVTASFTIEPKIYPQGIHGTLTDAVTGKVVPGAVVTLFDLENNVLTASAFTDINGGYTLYSPAGYYLVLALRVGYYAGYSVDDFSQLTKVLLNIKANQIIAHDTVITPGDRTISGRLRDSISGVGVPGIMLYGLSQTDSALHFAFNFSDNQGNFRLPVTAGPWAFSLPPLALARLGYVGATNQPPIDTSSGSVAAIDLPVPKATSLIYGRLVDALGNPLAGVRLDAFSLTNDYQTAGISDTNGDYSLGVIGGGWQVQPDSAAIDALGYEGRSATLQVADNQTLLQGFVFTPIPPPDPGSLAWRWLKPLPQGNDLHGVVFGLGRFVAVGGGGSILSSTDGMTWQVAQSVTPANLGGIASGNGMYVAVGGDGFFATIPSVLLISSNAVDWRLVDTGSDDSLNSVAFGNNLFVAASSRSLWSSADGVHWQTSDPGVTNYLRAVTFGRGQFVAVGDNGVVVTSTNGAQWTMRSSGTVDSLQAVAANDGLFAAAGITSVLTSPDAITWTTHSLGTNNDLSFNDLITVGGTFFGVGASGTIATSTNGAVWMRLPAPAGSSDVWLSGLASGAGKIVAVGESGTILTSSDGLTWALQRSGAVDPMSDVAWGRGLMVSADSQGRILSSSDGITWTPRYSDSLLSVRRIIYANGMFVAVGHSGPSWSASSLILASLDGIHWLPSTGVVGFGLETVAYGNGRFIAVGGLDDVLASTDGLHWSVNRTGSTNQLGTVAYGNGIFVAGEKSTGVFWISPDGSHWQAQDSGAGQPFNDLTFGGNQFVAVGYGGAIMVSADATNWRWSYSRLTETLRRVSYGAGNYVTVGNIIAVSADGLHWTGAAMSSPILNGVVYANRHFVAVGDNGTVLESGAITDSSPTITSQPVSHTVAAGAAVSLIVAAQGGGQLTFQWLRNAQPIVGATNASLTLPDAQPGAAGDYTVLVTSGGESVLSDPATVVIQGPPALPLTTWHPVAPRPTTNALFGITASRAAFNSFGWMIAVGDRGTILVSDVGLDWSRATSGTASALFSVAFGLPGGFVAVGDSGTILSSDDGFTWQSGVSGTTNALERVTYGAGRSVAVGDHGTLLTSVDGRQWVRAVSGTADDLMGVTTGVNGTLPLLVAVGRSGTILTSTNGTNWVARNSTLSSDLLGITYGGGGFVAVGDGGAMLTSGDGVSWRGQESQTTNSLWSVAFQDGYFVAVGENGVLLTSQDGAHWRIGQSGTMDTLYELAFVNGSFWAVGENGAVSWSDPLVVLGAVRDLATHLSLDGPLSRLYRIEYTDALAGANDWTWLTEVLLSDPAEGIADSYQPDAPSQRLYRALLLP